MSETKASAPGKVILFGEHAVVYGRPAIAAPLTGVRVHATVTDSRTPGIRLCALDLGREYWLQDSNEDDAFSRAVQVAISAVNPPRSPDLTITVQSRIPIASGLGSGAAMAAAVIRATYNHLADGSLIPDEAVSSLTYQVERLLHGTPSGIDNSVVAYEKAIFFMLKQPENLIDTLTVATPIHLLVADTGIASMTKNVVGDVRRRWQESPERFEKLFDDCGRVVQRARQAIELGETGLLGRLMSENQLLLQEMTVSSAELELLISIAKEAGAQGAKLSGAGRGGNIIALVNEEHVDRVGEALLSAGALGVLESVMV